MSKDVGYIYPPLLQVNGLFYYESFLDCSWIIKVDTTYVLFTVYITDIEYSENCSKDYLKVNEPVREKTNNLGSALIRHKPGCTVTDDG